MNVRFWGVRGSYPVAGPDTVRYGGHTSCIEVRLDDGSWTILDAGSGLRGLGDEMMENGFAEGGKEATFFITHTHWDHIMGMPFFAPAQVPGNRFTVYGRRREADQFGLGQVFVEQQASDYFDHTFSECQAEFRFHEIGEGDMMAAGGATITCARLNHPSYALGYRITADGGTLAYVTDTSPFDDILIEDEFIADPKKAVLPPNSPRREQLAQLHEALLGLLAGADLVIYDTFFEPEGYASRPHWGHSTPDHAIANCRAAGAKRLALFHHAPDNSDKTMDQLEDKYRQQVRGSGLAVFAAAEGYELQCCNSISP